MFDRFRHNVARLIAPRAPISTRRFDAAPGSRRWNPASTMNALNGEILAAAGPIRRRSSYFARNNPWLANGIEALVSNLIGSGIRPASKHPDPAARKALQVQFDRWTRTADADGTLDFYGQQAVATREMITSGECFGQMVSDDSAAGVPLRLRLIDAEMVDLADTRNLPDGAQVVGGVMFDGGGHRVAYRVAQSRPTDRFATTLPPLTIPAADMVHLLNPLAPGQVRGLAWTAPILLRLSDLDELEDAQLVRQKIAGLFAGFLHDPNADPATSPFQVDNAEIPTLEPGAMQTLPPGWDVRFATPGEASEGVAFIKSQLRAVAAGLGVPEFLLSGDLSEANYSSLRSGLVQFRRRIEALQYGVIIHQLCRPVWERFVTMAVLSGAVDAPDFEANTADWLSAEWYPPAAEWVDPLKDQEAEALAVASGFKSRRQVVAAQGYDIEALDAEIAADRARETALGLKFSAPPANQGATADAAS